jgi:HPt (histidine-containing phosphotransfer) domain-containing protein
MQMPVMDGCTATKTIRDSLHPDAAPVPIIAMTANVVAGMKQIFLKNGMNDFLPKPIDLLKLNQILAKWIPAEKQEPIILPPEYSANADGIAVERFLIPGLDTVRAVTLAGGAKNYLNILKTFPSDAVMKTEQIRSSRQSQDWKLYTTCVHGLRSALANVGSMPLSEQAERLTQAGRNGDMTVIENETETFLSDMMRLRSAVEEWLGVYQSESAIRAGATPPPIRGDLVLLKEALMKMDALTIHRILDELQSKPRPDAESTMLEQLYEHVIMFDFDLAAAQIDQYLATH